MSLFFQNRGVSEITTPAGERIRSEMEAAADIRKKTKAQIDPLLSDPAWYDGAMLSGFGGVVAGAASKLGFDPFDNGSMYTIPLNFEPIDPVRPSDFGFSGSFGSAFDSDPALGKNNLEGILELTSDIPDEDRRFILNAESWGEFQDRLTMYRMQAPQAMEELVAAGGTAPVWSAFATDASAIVALGVATEPLAWLGTANRLKAAGTAAATSAASAGTGQVAAAVALSQTIAKSAPVIGLAERAGRYAALGVIDQTIYTAGRYGLDPYYKFSGEQLALEYSAALVLGAGIGGALSKRMSQDLMRGYAQSHFSTLPIVPVTAATTVTPPAGAVLSGSVARAVAVGPSRISGSQAGGLVSHLRQMGIKPADFLAELKAEGIIDESVGSFGKIANDPETMAYVNKRLELAEVSADLVGPSFRLRPENLLGDSGASAVAKRAEEVVGSLNEGFIRGMTSGDDAVRAAAREEVPTQVNTVMSKLLSDMREAGYQVRRISEIPNDPDTVAKIDAWFDDLADGFNSPFGFRRTASDPNTSQFGGNVRFTAPPPNQAVSAVNQNQPSAATPANSTLSTVNAAGPSGGNTPAVAPLPAPPTQVPVRTFGNGAANPLPGAVSPTANPLDALNAAVPINNIRIPWFRRLLNQASYLLDRNQNPHARHFAYRAFFARRVLIDPTTGNPVPQPLTVMEEVKNILDTALARQIRSHQVHFQRFALGMTTADSVSVTGAAVRRAFGKGKGAAVKEFDDRVWRVVTTGTPDSSDVVNSFATEMRQLIDEAAEYARQQGVAGFENHRMLSNYFPRLYNWDAIQRVTATAQGRQALADLLAVALETTPGSRQLKLFDPVTGTYNTFQFTDIAEASQAFANRLMELAVGGEGAPLLDLDAQIVKAFESMQGPLRDRASSPSPRGRPRIILDESVEIDAGFDVFGTGNTKLKFGDLVNRDMVNAAKKYTTSVLGAAAERRVLNIIEEDLWQLGFRELEIGGPGSVRLTFKDIDEWISFANREGQIRFNGKPLTPEELEAIGRIKASLKFEPRVDTTATNTAGYVSQANYLATAGVSVAKAATFLMYSGAFGLAALAETGRTMMTFGPIKVFREMPTVAKMMFQEWNNLTIQNQGLTALLDQFGIATDRLKRTIFSTPEAEIQFSRRGRLRRGLGDLSNKWSDIVLLGPITSFTQYLTGISTLQHLMEYGKGAIKALDETTILSVGLTMQEYEAAAQFMAKNAVTKRRLLGRDAIIDINNTNTPEFDIVRRAMDRMVKTRIQDVSTIGDTSAYADTAWGSLLTQFKNYNIKAIDNLLLQNYSRVYNARGVNNKAASGARVAAEIAGAFFMAGLIKQAKTIIDAETAQNAGDLEQYEKIKENIGMKGFLKQGLLGPGELWLPVMATEAAWSSFNDEPLLSQFRWSSGDLLSFPVLEAGKTAVSVANDFTGAAIGKFFPGSEGERFITRKTTDNILKLTPNFQPIRRYLKLLDQEIDDYYDLPYEQPRR